MKREIIYTARIDEIKEKGIYYRTKNKTRSIITKDIVYKNLSGWDNDKKLAYKCLKIWQDMGYSGAPSSPVSFFRKEKIKGAIKATHNNLFRNHFFGGWIRAYNKGHISRKLYEYDLNKAYLWAASAGFPRKLKCYKKGDENFCCLFENNKSVFKRDDIPHFLKRKYILVEDIDIDFFDLKGEIIRGFSYSKDDLIFPEKTVKKYKDILPKKAYKTLTQGFWGGWAQFESMDVLTKNNEGKIIKKRIQKNYFQNLVWAFLTVRRVHRKMFTISNTDTVQVFVDSAIRTKKIKDKYIGEKIGQFKLKNVFEEGIFLKHAGIYDRLPFDRNKPINSYFKHSGVAS